MQEGKKDHDYMFKVVLIGLTGVGKSNILLRFIKDQFSTEWHTTLGVQFASKIMVNKSGTRIKLQIWDTAGQERYRSLMRTFYRGAAASLIVYDVTWEASFLNIEKEVQNLKDFTKADLISMLVGNKSDLQEKRAVSREKGMMLAESKKMAFYETSAKTGSNILLIFERLAEQLQKALTLSQIMADQRNIKKSITLSKASTYEKRNGCCS